MSDATSLPPKGDAGKKWASRLAQALSSVRKLWNKATFYGLAWLLPATETMLPGFYVWFFFARLYVYAQAHRESTSSYTLALTHTITQKDPIAQAKGQEGFAHRSAKEVGKREPKINKGSTQRSTISEMKRRDPQRRENEPTSSSRLFGSRSHSAITCIIARTSRVFPLSGERVLINLCTDSLINLGYWGRRVGPDSGQEGHKTRGGGSWKGGFRRRVEKGGK